MFSSEALVVGEEWIGEHFFTTDSKKESFHELVLKRRKEWDDNDDSVRARFSAERAELERILTGLTQELEDAAESKQPEVLAEVDEQARALYPRLLKLLGYAGGEYVTSGEQPMFVAPATLPEMRKLAILLARPALKVEDVLPRHDTTLLMPWRDEDDEITSVATALTTLATTPDGPEYFLVLAGRWLLVSDSERWLEGRYLAVDVQLVAERNDGTRGGEIDRALTILEAASLAPDSEGSIWWDDALAASVKHTVGVSKDLQAGVRESIEIIANEVVNQRREKGLPALPAKDAQELALQSLRYLYRILFLLYAEASPEMGVLPKNAPGYEEGYGLDRLRDLSLVELTGPQALAGTHLYESLEVLVKQLRGAPAPVREDHDGLDFQALNADLFKAERTRFIDEVKLRNAAMLQVLRKLLLSKEQAGKQRGFISYAELGINQLGAVYEGLMSYTGFFAEENLYEVAKDGDASKGSWVVPVNAAGHLDSKDFVTFTDELGDRHRVEHRAGQFVYRLSGRERQRSASYYTPEVLTKFTVGQALEELLDQDGHVTTAEEVLHLTICEPALGSGAFAIEAVRQLAEQYLKRREAELGERVDPDQRGLELQKVKAYLALHQTYGVDLNATAVELAEVSLWLDTMVAGLQAPWFGLRLRRGNSLVGARRQTYSREQLRKKAWLKTTPTPRALADDASGAWIHHFLLPAQGWGSAVDVPKSVRDLADEHTIAAVKAWRGSVRVEPSDEQTERLLALGQRVETLWSIALRRLQIAETESRRRIDVWGRDEDDVTRSVTREEIERYLHQEGTAYQRLRQVMDAWCALWYWPLTSDVTPPNFAEWLDALEGILGVASADDPTQRYTRVWRERRAKADEQAAFDGVADWAELEQLETGDARRNDMRDRTDLEADYPWLRVCKSIAETQGFFHWELEFATVFERGGFDLQVGNPPWVRPRSDVEALLAEGDPWWQLAVKPSEKEKAEQRELTLARPGIRDTVLDGTTEVTVFAELLSDSTMYPLLSGQPDLYRAFMCQVWSHQKDRGISSLIHMETHFTDEKASVLRRETYRRLRRHWQFFNELMLFDIDDKRSYGIAVYGRSEEPNFLHATTLFHPETVISSMRHNGAGEEPGFKYNGKWDQRPHAARIQRVDQSVLALWQDVIGAESWAMTPMVYAVNSAASRTLAKMASARRVGALDLQFSRGWDESIDRKAGRFVSGWGEATWNDAILQGPHLHVSTPLYKSPNPTMKHNQDWSATDFEALATDQLPVTAYKPAGDRAEYDRQYTHWDVDGERLAARDYYRVAWRSMAANRNERTLMAGVIPPGAAHVNGVFSVGLPGHAAADLVAVQASAGSLLSDFNLRSAPKSGIYLANFARLPLVPLDHPLLHELILRTLRLNCVTEAYADLWAECWRDEFLNDAPILERFDERPIAPQWSADTPLRRAVDRRNAQVEIDALVALMLGVPVDDLCTIYRTQFAVLYGYDQRDYTFDAHGRLVPNAVLTTWRRAGEPETNADLPASDRTAAHPGSGIDYVYELPFATRDREADFRAAYAAFETRMRAQE